MKKVVTFIGRNDSFFLGGGNPAKLVVGKQYIVATEYNRGKNLFFILQGVEGSFPSSWFDIMPYSSVFIAFSKTVPAVGLKCRCYRFTFKLQQPTWQACLTTPVEDVILLGCNIYEVTTCNSIYIIQVIQ